MTGRSSNIEQRHCKLGNNTCEAQRQILMIEKQYCLNHVQCNAQVGFVNSIDINTTNSIGLKDFQSDFGAELCNVRESAFAETTRYIMY